MKSVNIDTVQGFTQTNSVSGSYMQDAKHAKVSDKFAVIQPAAVGAELAKFGFSLVSLITGKGRHADKANHQRTIARYRSQDAFEIDGLQLDIIYISKHLGRGCDELRLGLFRGVCANQWTAGSLFEIVRFRHSGNPIADIAEGIQSILNQRAMLVETIRKMQAYTPTPMQVAELIKNYGEIRLEGIDNVVSIDFRTLATVRRDADKGTDLFTVANVLQENVIRMPLRYGIRSVDANGLEYVRNMSTRRYRESSSQLVELNSKLFDAALKLIA